MPYNPITDTTMTQNTNTPKLNAALVKAISETQDVVADSTNPYHNSKYASLSAHLKTLKPIFAKHGLAIIQMPSSSHFDSGLGIKTLIIHESGESIESCMVLQTPVEKGVDKNGNAFERVGYTGQQAGALISYLRRYALAAVAGVSTEDDDAETDRASFAGSQPSQSIQTTKFIPNTSVSKPAAAAPSGMVSPSAFPIEDVPDIDSVVMPFGKNKGTPLSQLTRNDWEWIVNKMELKPFNGKISAKDIKLKNAARILLQGGNSNSEESSDDVPF
jgi:hypothetical protein